MFLLTAIRTVRKGFNVYSIENCFTRFIDSVEANFIIAIEEQKIETLKQSIRIFLFIYSCLNLLVYVVLEKYFGTALSLQGFILSLLFMFSLLGMMDRESYSRKRQDILDGWSKYGILTVKLVFYYSGFFYIVNLMFMKEQGMPLFEDYSYLWKGAMFITGAYSIYFCISLAKLTACFINYSSGNILAKGLKKFTAHCKKYSKSAPMLIFTFWTEIVLFLGSISWSLMKISIISS
ncbi:hypothetical protein [Ekhidna sp.]|jgi:hypothetical protein|uniref:hypothetical protein n=1 Tax=Ekhidna sp. TaxID=2608089 RepID=UPI0032ED8347